MFEGTSIRLIDVAEIKFQEDNKQVILGAGSYGRVRRGEWRSADVAVKTLNLHNRELLVAEVTALNKVVPHPFICPVFGVCDKYPFSIVYEYMPQGSLDQHLIKIGSGLDTELVLLMAMDICKGMVHVHAQEVMHRDLKPANLLIQSLSKKKSKIRLKLCDFGIAKEVVDSLNTIDKGSPAYLAPEILEKPNSSRKVRYSYKVDIYSFAMCVWQMLSGRPPFDDVSPYIFLPQVMQGERPATPDHVPPRLASLIQQCWDGQPDRRPPFTEILETLNSIYTELLLGSSSLPGLMSSSSSSLSSSSLNDPPITLDENVIISSSTTSASTPMSLSTSSMSSPSSSFKGVKQKKAFLNNMFGGPKQQSKDSPAARPDVPSVGIPVSVQHDKINIDFNTVTGFEGIPREWEAMLRSRHIPKDKVVEDSKAVLEALEFK
eukprot:TRINITY_DN15831_c0_g1_i1.p1 TRINITY_DN15831_c0_g1~~TRINITY_DN15831_c0_g1_i1.p1  ORF type:complete len:433 (-),score=87.08 TRINITY_DN15831_c0_g1_i1:8-1306(-)